MLKVKSIIALLFVIAFPQFAAAQDNTPRTKMVAAYETVDVQLWPGAILTQGSPFPYDGPIRRFLRRVGEGQIWQWAPRAEHHQAAVMVRCPDGSAGSGTIIRIRGAQCVVITCAHVTGNNRSVNIQFPSGERRSGQVILKWDNYDLAGVLIGNPPAGFYGIPVASVEPPADAQIEVMGFGGPNYGTFRPYIATRYSGQGIAKISIDAPSISGDSGGGMVYNGQLVGVQFGAYTEVNPPPQVKGVSLIYPASSKAGPEVMVQFTQRVCSPLGCQPEYGRPDVQIDMGRSQSPGGFYPPPGYAQQPIAQPQPSPQPIPQPPAGNAPLVLMQPISVEDLQQRIVDLLAADPRFKGPAGDAGPAGAIGPAGPQGPAGKDGVDGADATITTEQLAAIAGAITEKLRDDPKMKGSQGERGPVGIAGPAGPAGSGISAAQLAAIKADVLASIPPIRFVLADGSTKSILDDETYQPGEPIVLDVQRIVNAATAR